MTAAADRPGHAASRRTSGPGPEPRPAVVRGNDWRQVALPDAGTFVPSLPVSVILPCFETPDALALTLAGLERQHWPRDLVEVVVVDDGSAPPLAPSGSTPLDVRVVRQERRGFGLARARNTGVRAAAHDILVFLDADTIPEAGLLAAHARWHHAVSDALTLGFWASVSVDGIDAAAVRGRPGSLRALFADRDVDPPWIERHMARTGDLTAGREDLFRAVTGSNIGFGRAFFEEIGGFDESFNRYGGEDTELAYRAQVRGGLLVPVRDAVAWHQGRWASGREAKQRDQDLQAGTLAELIADPGFRPAARGRTFAVPRHVVSVDAAEGPAARALETAAAVLADPGGDLVVRIELPADREAERAWLDERLGPGARVRMQPGYAALDEFPASPFHIAIPAGAGAVVGRAPVERLRAALGDAAAASAVLPDGRRVAIVRAWALHRARRAGGAVADYGTVRTLAGRTLRGGIGWPRRVGRWGRGLRGGSPGRRGTRAVLARVWAEARHVRGLRTAWRFVRWLAGAVRWRMRAGRAGWLAAPAPAAAGHADPPLGAAIATLGPRARAALAASTRVARDADAAHATVVLADTAAEAAGLDAPVVLLTDRPALGVPAFDPALDNPVGWVRDVECRAAALGPVHLLPDGSAADRVVQAEDRRALGHCHHLEDVAAFHAGAAERAGTLARIAARGAQRRHAAGGAAHPFAACPRPAGLYGGRRRSA